MTNLPFGFSSQDPDDGHGENNPGGPGNPGPLGGPGSEFDFNQLGQMLSQLGQMLSQSGGSGAGPVNYDLAKQIAVQQLTGIASATSEQTKAVGDAVRLAELWLDPVTSLPTGATRAEAWSARDWVERTLSTWQRLCDPVARRVSGAWVEALPAEAKEAAGPLLSMVGQMGGMAFGSQLGNALAQLGKEVLASTEIGLPLGPEGVAALLPANIEEFTSGLERPASEVIVFLAAREAALHRLFTHVPWLRQRLLATVEEFAHGITVDTSALEQLATQVDPANPQSIEEAMSSGLLEPKNTPQQQAALTRLETLLALVEGWVDVVVAEAVGERLPGAEALRETLRRRRASGGPAEQTFATLVGLELRPKRLRDAANLWKIVGDRHGVTARDDVWSHPDLVPTAEDLDEPLDFADRVGRVDTDDLDDPIAALERAEQAKRAKEAGSSESEPGSDEGPAAEDDDTAEDDDKK
ncbi:MAG TPA: zinc-dependent metalloprotease [Pseudonocardiaceae bacterium]|jgi:putative hydrolase|nr:zinc-dependent metalloprotease [Pseudonocardiaceae bacterium]